MYGGAEGRNSRGTHGHTTPCTNSRAQHEHECISISCNCHTATVTTWDQINSIEQNSDLASVHCEQRVGGLGTRSHLAATSCGGASNLDGWVPACARPCGTFPERGVVASCNALLKLSRKVLVPRLEVPSNLRDVRPERFYLRYQRRRLRGPFHRRIQR